MKMKRAFALPTILLASTILLIVLVVTAAAASSVTASLNNQYYNQLAKEAAESGLAYGRYCYGVASGNATASQWPNSGSLTPYTDCYGNTKSGQSCPGTTSLCNIVNDGKVHTTFSVDAPGVDASAAAYSLHSSGQAMRLRSSSHAVYKTYTKDANQQISINLNGIASGNDTTCSIQNGQLYCWGKNDKGQVGNGTTTTPVVTPYHVQGALAGKYVQYVATGISHTCAVAGTTSDWRDGNQVYCWGDNSLGQLGTNNETSSLLPTPGAYGLASGRAVGCNAATPDCTPLSARDHTCIIAQPQTGSGYNSAVEYCWGDDRRGQSGQLNSGDAGPPPADSNGNQVKLRPGTAIVKKAGGGLYYFITIGNVSGELACGINGTALGQTSGGLYCWGGNYDGELGLGDGVFYSLAQQVTATPVSGLGSNVTKVTTNNGRVCALMSARLYCWGDNGGANPKPAGTPDYRLDSGPTMATKWATTTPTRIITSASSLYNASISDFAISDWNTCIVTSGKVYCSGYNDLGQLGQGTTSGPAHGAATSASQVRSANNMVQVKGVLDGQTVTQITSGNNHFCAITTSKNAYCWGSNDYGQLGNGTTDPGLEPKRVHIPATVIY